MSPLTVFKIINLIFEALFFITVGTVTILTYIQAKDTLLQPMKTKIFKMQIEELSKILSIFIGKGEIQLREYFGLDDLILFNSISLLDDFGSLFFDIEINENERPYNKRHCTTSLVSQEYMEKNFELVDNPIFEEPEIRKKKIPDSRVRASLWQNYQYGIVKLPNGLTNAINKLESILESPFIPNQISKEIEEFLSIIHKNTLLVKDVLTECAKDLPQKYSTIDEFKQASSVWISNKYNSDFTQLKPQADKIIDSIRTHWNIDKISL